MNKDKITRAGLEPATSGLTCRGSTNWAIYLSIGVLPMLSISLFGGAPVRSHGTIYCPLPTEGALSFMFTITCNIEP